MAEKYGFCFGVKSAVEKSIQTALENERIVYTLGEIIHNKDVVLKLKEKKIVPIEFNDIDILSEGDIIIIRSHGVSKFVHDKLIEKKLKVIDATCPYVLAIQKRVSINFKNGDKIIIVGDKHHPEVIGINGWCNDEAIVVKDTDEVKTLSKDYKYSVVSQTTEKDEIFNNICEYLIDHEYDIKVYNTICSSTRERQLAAEKLSKIVDVMIIIGSKNSSNTQKLYQICVNNCKNTILVENSDEIPDNIIYTDKNKMFGVTAGASTPEWIIEEAIRKMDENKLEMNEQLAYMEEFDKVLSIGSLVEGQVVSLDENEAYVNIGYKAEALLPISEVTEEDNVKLTEVLHAGEKIKAKVLSLGNETKPPIISIIEIRREEFLKERKEAYDELEKFSESGEVITVRVTRAVKGGVEADYKGTKIFIPASHMELIHVEDLSIYEGKNVDVNIIEYTTHKRRLPRVVASRRGLLKNKKLQMEEITWEKIRQGDIVQGIVRRITNFGAFVEVDGVDGLLHVSELSHGRVEKPEDVLRIGSEITVAVISVDKENKKLSLSLKNLLLDPWSNIKDKYPVGNIVLGKVVRFASFGAFVELEPGVDGLIHVSHISTRRVEKPEDELQIGQMVKAKILQVDDENKKISLSIREVENF